MHAFTAGSSLETQARRPSKDRASAATSVDGAAAIAERDLVVCSQYSSATSGEAEEKREGPKNPMKSSRTNIENEQEPGAVRR